MKNFLKRAEKVLSKKPKDEDKLYEWNIEVNKLRDEFFTLKDIVMETTINITRIFNQMFTRDERKKQDLKKITDDLAD